MSFTRSAVTGPRVTRGPAWRAVCLTACLVFALPACQEVSRLNSNRPPVATASGTPTSGAAPLAVNFTGTGTDPDGAWIAYAWDFGDGASAKQQTVSHTYTSTGTYKATLTVTDANLAEGKATVAIAVGAAGNQPPSATISASPTSGTAPFQVGFSGSGSDPDGSIVSYAWNFGDGGTSTQQVTTHTYQTAGNYTATLTVTDNGGAKGSASVSIAAGGAGNQPPVAGASATPTFGAAPLAVAFTGSGTDPDGTIASYAWAFGDGGTSTQQSPSHTYQTTGNYTATLTVTDNNGATGSASVNVTVGANQPPTASASATPKSGKAPLAVAFTGSGTDPDGTIASYAWTFGDGGTSTLQNPAHSYAAAGSYTATLTVTDNGGAKGSASVTIAVQPGNQAPVANAGADQVNRDCGATIGLDGTASIDPDGGTLTYQWTQTAGATVTLSGANTATPSFVAPAASTATYTFTLTVTDNGSPPASTQDTVNVSARVTYVNTIQGLFADRGKQANGKNLGCVSCHAPGKSRPNSPLTTYSEVYNWRSQARSLLSSGGSMRQYLATGEPDVVIKWIDAGVPEKN